MKSHNNNTNNTNDTNDPDLSTTSEEEGTEPDDSGDRSAYCRDELVPMFDTERKTFKQGEDATVRGDISVLQADYKLHNTPVEVNFVSPSGKKYGSHDVEPEFFTECGFTFKFVVKNVRELGRWKVSAVYSPVDVAVGMQFEVVTKKIQQQYIRSSCTW